MPKSDNINVVWGVVAGVLAWVIPGAGHALLGRWVRGVIIFLCITGLFWSGAYIGGVFTVDPIKEKWWCYAQLCTGASGIYSYLRQERTREAITAEAGLKQSIPPAQPIGGSPYDIRQNYDDWNDRYNALLAEKHLALVDKGDQVARAYSGIAGMLNILCIFDAVMLGLMGRRGEPVPPRLSREDRP